MNGKIKYSDEPIGEIEVVRDFLPSPEELAFHEEGTKVTLALSRKSVEFFKAQASMHHTQYQRMIRRLLDSYVDAQQRKSRKPAPTRVAKRNRVKRQKTG